MTIASNFLLNDLAKKLMNDITTAKIIINDVAEPVNITKKEIVENDVVRVYIDFLIGGDDVFNGIEFYDASNNLLISDRLNLAYNVQGATYLYECDLFSEKVI